MQAGPADVVTRFRHSRCIFLRKAGETCRKRKASYFMGLFILAKPRVSINKKNIGEWLRKIWSILQKMIKFI
jgi:hypothetical protein